MRQIVLDTETTGLEPEQGHRIIEIGCIELIDRKRTGAHFHAYVNPEREIDEGALEVHGITREFLDGKPTFADICEDFVEFVRGAELIIHNAPFDTSFLDDEFSKVPETDFRLHDICRIEDSLDLARRRHPGQRNSLDALCRRYGVDNTHRKLHGALLDAEILARYATLGPSEVADMVVASKWMASIRDAISRQLDCLTTGLVDRISVLEARYAEALPELAQQAEDLEARVRLHLRDMGIAW